MRNFIFIMITLLILTVPVDNAWSAEGKVKQITLNVEGMTCASCPAMIKMALKKLDGIVDTDVSYEKSKATVRYRDGKVTVEQMIKAIEDIGMKASPFAKGE